MQVSGRCVLSGVRGALSLHVPVLRLAVERGRDGALLFPMLGGTRGPFPGKHPAGLSLSETLRRAAAQVSGSEIPAWEIEVAYFFCKKDYVINFLSILAANTLWG